jgi:hypothetical protein
MANVILSSLPPSVAASERVPQAAVDFPVAVFRATVQRRIYICICDTWVACHTFQELCKYEPSLLHSTCSGQSMYWSMFNISIATQIMASFMWENDALQCQPCCPSAQAFTDLFPPVHVSACCVRLHLHNSKTSQGSKEGRQDATAWY